MKGLGAATEPATKGERVSDIVLFLAVFAALLMLVALSQPLAAKLRLAPVVLLAVIGASISGAAGFLLHFPLSERVSDFVKVFVDLPLGADVFIYVFLPLLVFEAALTSDVRRIVEDAAPILMLAVIATLVAAGIVGVALWPFSGLPLVVCLLLGAVVSTTDPAAVIAIFRDVGAPARLTRLVEGEALLNDAAAIVAYTVLLGVIASGRPFHLGDGAIAFFVSFLGGAALGFVGGRILLALIPWTRDDRLAEATLTVALAYLSYIVADHIFHVSGVVAVLVAGLTVGAFGRTRITPDNWSFLTDLWAQVAFWAHSLVFLLASILVPQLLGDLSLRDLGLLGVLIVAVFGARLAVLFLLLPLLSLTGLTQPISTAYKLAIAWGGLRGALTLVLAFSLTENPALSRDVQHFVTVLATGLVLFTLLVNGSTLRWVIQGLGLDRLSPIDRLLRDRVLELSYAEMSDSVREIAKEHQLSPAAEARALAPYAGWKTIADRDRAGEIALTDRERIAVSLVALGNQERMLVLQTLASRAASPNAVQSLMRNADALTEAARTDGQARIQARLRRRDGLFLVLQGGLFPLSAARDSTFSCGPSRRAVRDAPSDAGACPAARRRSGQALTDDLRRAARSRDRKNAQRIGSIAPSPGSTPFAANIPNISARSRPGSSGGRRCAGRWGATSRCSMRA